MQLQLPHAYTASHPASVDTRHCQDDHPQCCLIAAGLLQYTTATILKKLQVAQNTLARVMCQAARSVSTMEFKQLYMELRRQLH